MASWSITLTPAQNINESFSFGAQHFNLNFGTNAESEAFARAIRALKDGLRGLYPFGPELRMIRAVDGKNRTGRLIGRPESSGKRLKGGFEHGAYDGANLAPAAWLR